MPQTGKRKRKFQPTSLFRQNERERERGTLLRCGISLTRGFNNRVGIVYKACVCLDSTQTRDWYIIKRRPLKKAPDEWNMRFRERGDSPFSWLNLFFSVYIKGGAQEGVRRVDVYRDTTHEVALKLRRRKERDRDRKKRWYDYPEACQ